MESQDQADHSYSWFFETLKTNKETMVLGVAGLFMLAIGIAEWRREEIPDNRVEIVEASPEDQNIIGGVVVDISGAVTKPGLYRFPNQTRVGEVLDAAGGLATSADSLWIAKNLNLASKVSDGMKIFIPQVGEDAESVGVNPQTGSIAGVTTININIASESELDRLSGIGAARAKDIVSNRPYASIEELVSKKVISQSIFDQIKTEISVN